jgi:hypothetical protein
MELAKGGSRIWGKGGVRQALHIKIDDSFMEIIIHICMVFGYDLLCDLLEMLNLINIGRAVATHRNLVDPIQRMNMRGLMAEMFRATDLRTGCYSFESRWILFFILFVSVYFLFLCVICFRRIFQYYPLSFLQLIF